jgi:hypothetical protein
MEPSKDRDTRGAEALDGESEEKEQGSERGRPGLFRFAP